MGNFLRELGARLIEPLDWESLAASKSASSLVLRTHIYRRERSEVQIEEEKWRQDRPRSHRGPVLTAVSPCNERHPLRWVFVGHYAHRSTRER